MMIAEGKANGYFRLALICLALGMSVAPAVAAKFKTTSFNARMKLSNDRTITVDETIQIELEKGSTGGITDLVLADPPPGRHVSYSVNRAAVVLGGKSITLKAKPNAANSLVATIEPSMIGAAQSFEVHANYVALGGFEDKTGGTLGSRSTLTWNILPTTWPTTIPKANVEAQYPEGMNPVYISATQNPDGSAVTVTSRDAAKFSGSTTALPATTTGTSVSITPAREIGVSEGLRFIIALPTDQMKAAPASLPVSPNDSAPAVTETAPAPKPSERTNRSVNPSPGPSQPESKPASRGGFRLILPLVVPLVFLLLVYGQFRFQKIRGLPNAEIPEKLGPAEAGYLLDGDLKARHLVGAAISLSDRGFLRVADLTGTSALEARLVQLIREQGAAMSPESLKKLSKESRDDLEGNILSWLKKSGYWETPSDQMKRFAAVILPTIVIDGYVALGQGTWSWIMIAVGLAATVGLLFSYRPLSKRGLRALRRADGLRRFLWSEANELKTPTRQDYLLDLRPYAIAFGVIEPS